MLQTLSIRDFAIIDAVDLELGAGLTVITGETGAGKSILIDALNLVLGGRARTEVIRTGAEQARVEALFDLRSDDALRQRLTEAGIEAGAELIVQRVLARNGRHRIYLNGALATAGTLAQVAGGLVDISGQHEHYSLLRADFHLDLLDRVGVLGAQRARVEDAHRVVAALDARLADLLSRQRDRAEREDFLRFQLQDLTAARLTDAEEEEALEQEAGRLRNVEKLRESARAAEQDLYGANGAAAERLRRALRHVEALARLDAALGPMVDDLGTALAIVEDAAHSLGVYGRDLAAEPDRLDQIEERLTLFARLRRKYGATLAEVIERQRAMEAELETLSGSEAALGDLERERAEAADALLGAAETLTAARRDAGDRFVAAVQAELADLGMGGAELVVQLDPLTAGCAVAGRHIGPRGADRVEFLLSANPGETPQPLQRIASGGELSRFMLAVKRVIAERDPVGTYIFDEVDTGVGGPTAEAIGKKLRAVSAQRQALCITHLPQIAAMGHQHLVVSKVIEGGRTRSEVTLLDHPGRVEELARMLGGTRVTATTRAHAHELLAHAAQSG